MNALECTSRDLMLAAMRREPTPRIPTMPQICHDMPVRLYAHETGDDWIETLRRALAEPARLYDYVIRLVEETGCDGLRLFISENPVRAQRAGDELVVVDPKTDRRLGRIDTHGGGRFVPDDPPLPIETVEDARRRLEAMVADVTDEKIQQLADARRRLPTHFVASAPGSITMDTYVVLRGRQRALVDLCEEPDFVAAVFDLQVEAVIRRAEKLLTTGIDALYIGDPSASGSLIGPWHFEQFCLPAYRKFCDHFKDRGVLIYIHVCGNSNPILEMLASTGADVVEPLDPLGGVSVADAKGRIGGRVGLMGGVNTLTLSKGTPEDVTTEAIQKCREGGPHGYVLAAGDMVPPDTPRENLQAMVDVATQSLWKG